MDDGLELFRSEAVSAEGLLAEKYNLALNANPLCLTGTLPLLGQQGELIDAYEIQIVPTEAYPGEFPLVYETGGRLPPNIDWHIYPDGHFCIKAWPEEILICNQSLTLLSFIEEQVIPYLFNQKHREEYGYFLNERSHGTAGNLEFFKDLFRTDKLSLISEYLDFIARKEKPNRVAQCFCGSGIKYRKCHREAYQLLSSLPDDVIALYKRMVA